MGVTHTPGPWVINEDWLGDDLKNHVPVSAMQARGGHRALAQVVWVMEDDRNMGRGSPVCEANARLIAAAPELLDALRLVMNCAGDISSAPDSLLEMALDDGDDETRNQANAFLVARAAIAKATGSTS